MMKSNPEHWNRIYSRTDEDRLGWYEEDPAPTFDLLCQVDGWEHAVIFLPGAGTTALAGQLLAAGAELIINDFSASVLERMKARLGPAARKVTWSCRDIARPLGEGMPKADVWIDRAVLHFLTEEREIKGYFENVMTFLKPGGHILFAEYPPHGASECAGLQLHRYSLEELSGRLGAGFKLLDCFDHTYINPDGDKRPYIYALFRRGE